MICYENFFNFPGKRYFVESLEQVIRTGNIFIYPCDLVLNLKYPLSLSRKFPISSVRSFFIAYNRLNRLCAVSYVFDLNINDILLIIFLSSFICFLAFRISAFFLAYFFFLILSFWLYLFVFFYRFLVFYQFFQRIFLVMLLIFLLIQVFFLLLFLFFF